MSANASFQWYKLAIQCCVNRKPQSLFEFKKMLLYSVSFHLYQ
jgi:hypothetical protein